jgi:hypothetical protein
MAKAKRGIGTSPAVANRAARELEKARNFAVIGCRSWDNFALRQRFGPDQTSTKKFAIRVLGLSISEVLCGA